MPMLIRGEDGHEFELALIEDRLPDSQDPMAGNAAFTVSFRVATEQESWEETAPAVNTYEIRNLVEWLESVGEGVESDRGEEAEIDLLEPELNFAVVKDHGDRVTLRVAFHLEDRPEEFQVDAQTDEAARVDLRVTRRDVKRAAAQLRDDLHSIERMTDPDRDHDEEMSQIRRPDEDLAILDDEAEEPPLAGDGLTNAEDDMSDGSGQGFDPDTSDERP